MQRMATREELAKATATAEAAAHDAAEHDVRSLLPAGRGCKPCCNPTCPGCNPLAQAATPLPRLQPHVPGLQPATPRPQPCEPRL